MTDNFSAGKTNVIFIVLLPTLECNLRCSYCFEKHPPGRWDVKATRIILTNVFDLLRNRNLNRCRLHWQGGEPLLLGESYWQEVLPMSRFLADQQGVHLSQSMQTNLTIYQTSFQSMVQEFFDGVLGTSFEPTDMRKSRHGDPAVFLREWSRAYDTALKDGLEVGVLSLINEKALRMGASLYLTKLREDHGIKRIRFTLPFRTLGKYGMGFWLDAHETGLFLAEMYRIWYRAGGNNWMEIRPFKHLTARLRGESVKASGLCVYANNCADIALSILPNGNVTLCDSFAHPEAEMTYGNIFRESLTVMHGGARRKVVCKQVAALVNSECAQCRYLGLCFGGCLARSHPAVGTIQRRYHYCETHKLLFHAIEEIAIHGESVRS